MKSLLNAFVFLALGCIVVGVIVATTSGVDNIVTHTFQSIFEVTKTLVN